jgi:hypothetical protein
MWCMLPSKCVQTSSIAHVDGGVANINSVFGVSTLSGRGLDIVILTDYLVSTSTSMSQTQKHCNTYQLSYD